jgi:hypothetical protein
MGLEPIGSTPAQLAAVQKADFEKCAKPLKASGYQADWATPAMPHLLTSPAGATATEISP